MRIRLSFCLRTTHTITMATMKIATTMTTETITIVTVFENNDFSSSGSSLDFFKTGFSNCLVSRVFKVEVTGVDFVVLRSGKVVSLGGLVVVETGTRGAVLRAGGDVVLRALRLGVMGRDDLVTLKNVRLVGA